MSRDSEVLSHRASIGLTAENGMIVTGLDPGELEYGT